MDNDETLHIPKSIKESLIAMAEKVMNQDNCGTRSPIYHTIRRPVAMYSPDENYTGSDAEPVVFYNEGFSTPFEFMEEQDELDDPEKFWMDDVDQPLFDEYGRLHQEDLFDFTEKMEECRPDACLMWRWYENQDYTNCGTFITRQAAQDFLNCNRHHVGDEAYVYVRYAWRNPDAELLQELFESIYNNKGKENE